MALSAPGCRRSGAGTRPRTCHNIININIIQRVNAEALLKGRSLGIEDRVHVTALPVVSVITL
jgi:hypothetical protein